MGHQTFKPRLLASMEQEVLKIALNRGINKYLQKLKIRPFKICPIKKGFIDLIEKTVKNGVYRTNSNDDTPGWFKLNLNCT